MLMISGSQHAFTLCWHCVYNSFHSVHIALTFVYNTFTLRARKVQKSCENTVKQSIFCVHTNSYKSILQIILFTILLHYAHIHSAIRLHCANTNFRLPWILLQSNSAELYRKSMDTEGSHGWQGNNHGCFKENIQTSKEVTTKWKVKKWIKWESKPHMPV